jgi:hypothetical protein
MELRADAEAAGELEVWVCGGMLVVEELVCRAEMVPALVLLGSPVAERVLLVTD